MTDTLDTRRGAIFKSSYEYPGRYNRWSLGFVCPPLELSCNARSFKLKALNDRGGAILRFITPKLRKCSCVASISVLPGEVQGEIAEATAHFSEEERSRQPSIFSIIRDISDLFHSDEDHNLGLYGAFGYDLAFQFEKVEQAKDRGEGHRDLVLWLPDSIVCIDEHSTKAWRIDYKFNLPGEQVESEPWVPGTNPDARFVPSSQVSNASEEPACDHVPGEYANLVRRAKQEFLCGNLFECVPSQTFSKPWCV